MNTRRTAGCYISPFILAGAALLLAAGGRADVPPGTLMWFQSSLSSGNGTAEARAVAVDLNDNTIVVGRFVGTVNFFGTNLTATSTNIPSGFAAKFAPSGAVLWCELIATTNWTELTAVSADPAGNIYIGGTASGNFTNGAVTLNIPVANGQDAFLAKLDSLGNTVWGNFFGGTNTDSIVAMQYAKDGTLAVCGNFTASIGLGMTTYTSPGGPETFCARLAAADGTVVNSWRIGAGRGDTAGGLSIDKNGNICLSGHFLISTDFGSGSVAGPGFNNSYLAKYTAFGSLLWYRMYGAAAGGNPVSVGRSNEVWLLGSFSGVQAFGSFTLRTTNGLSMFLVKLDSSGNELVARKYGDGPGANDFARGAVAGNSGRLSLTGQFKSNPSDWGSYGTTAGTGLFDTTFATTDDSGTVLWARQVLATNQIALTDSGYAVALSANEDQIFVGRTSAGDYGAGTNIVVGTGGLEAFVARYRGFGPDAAASPTNYAAWAARHFPVQMIDDPAFGGVNGNPFGDGIVNFWKYIFNQDPWAKGTNLVTTSYVTNRFSFNFPRSKRALDARAWLMSSTNLPADAWTSNATITTTSPLDTNFDRVTLTDAVGITNTVPMKFLRMRGTNGP